jgi:metallophosphoesterase superfamily enzyme
MKDKRPRLKGEMAKYVKSLKNKERRVLIIGDLHQPFTLDSYFDHCVSVKEKYGCNEFVFIGDCIDSHFSSFHTTDVDGMGGGEELDLAINKLKRWVKESPDAYITLGNHDRIILRKAFEGGIPKAWIRSFNDILEAPNWKFVDSIILDNVLYHHGEGGTARTKMKKELMSTVQGHLHTQGYIEYMVGRNYKIFGMQVGSGIDKDSYAMAYAKNFGKPFLACAVVLKNGTQPILEPMNL